MSLALAIIILIAFLVSLACGIVAAGYAYGIVRERYGVKDPFAEEPP